MKNNLENSIKESLKDFEMPYNPKAWEALSSKLDAKLPTTAPKSNFKWYAIAGTVIVASIGTYFYLTHDDHAIENNQDRIVLSDNQGPNNVELKEIHSESVTEHQSSDSQDQSNEGDITNVSSDNQGSSSSNNANSGSSNDHNPFFMGNGSNGVGNGTIGTGSGNGTNSGNSNESKDNKVELSETITDFKAPVVSSACLGEAINIKNNNPVKMWIISPTGESFHIKPESAGSYTTAEAGLHKIGYYSNDGFVEKTSFNVLTLPFVDFYINQDQSYEDGIPVTKVETTVPGSKFTWNLGSVTQEGRDAEGHFFAKGSYDITLTVTGANGCNNSKTESIFIEHEYGDRGNYNLLAPNAIYLNSSDEKNRTFMPDGLKLRDVKFKMVIYSLYDGHIVFETTDPSKAWDGIDQQTGRTVDHASTYHWEVIVENPMKGENPKYKGSLTVLIN